MANETGSRAILLRRLGAGLVCSAASAILLTGCAAGQQAQTVQQTPSIDGVQADAGNIAIRAAGIASPQSGTSYPKGSTAQLRMVLINRADQPDKLVSVTSPAASEVRLSGTGGGPGSATGSAAASGASSTSTGATASGSGSASASSSGSAGSTSIDLPGRQSVEIGSGSGGPSVTLAGLTQQLFSSQPVPVTFTFQSGASVTVTMAVQLTSEVPEAPTVSSATEAPGE